MSTAPPSEDQLWLAQQYLLGELDNAADFESRLEHDPAACDALTIAARNLLLLQEALAAPRQPLPTRPHDHRRWAVGVSVAALAAAALLTISPFPLPGQGSRGETVARAAEIVAGWSLSDADVLTMGDLATELDDDTEDSVPAWLLTAVVLETEAAPDIPAREQPL